MAELTSLKKRRSVNKGKVTFILNGLKKSTEISIEECKAKLNRVEKLMDEFTSIENHIFDIDPTQDADLEYEENYYKAITELNKIIRKLGLNTVANASFDQPLNTTQTGADVRLPKLNIPPFSGNYTEWQSFYDLYVASIHDSGSLTAVQKFQYLKGLLRGEAASLLRHFSITDSNYIEALNKLRQRYDRKRHTINAFIKTFLEQPPISTANNVNVKRLLDISDETLRGLKAMGNKGEERDPWLIYILISKLDDESRGLWAQHTANKDFPTIQELFDFLLQRSDALDSIRSSSIKRSQITRQSTIQGHPVVNEQQIECPVCRDSDHLIYQCKKFNEMEIQTRRDWVKTNRRCFNCLSDNHAVFKCSSRRRCVTCKRKHHSLLHSLEIETTPGACKEHQTADSGCSPDPMSSLHINGQASSIQSILPTAILKVMSTTGKILRCRALLDSGSQASFITESCIQRLGVRRKNGRISVRGLGHVDAGTTRGVTTIYIHPEVGPTISVNAFILNRISSKLPEYPGKIINIDELQKMPLADPDFYKSNEIDILLGVDHFFNILVDGQIRETQNALVLQNTIFGWVVAGNFKDDNNCYKAFATEMTSNICKFNIDETLKRFWEIEAIPNETPFLSPEEKLCEQSFIENLRRTPEGSFEVRLPFKDSPAKLGKSLNIAIQRLTGMERRFSRDTKFFELYKNFMTEYHSLGHMKEILPTHVKDDGFFLPHHGVIKQASSTTKLRVVFDGSAKTSTGVSLNDCLAVGATVQSSLYSIILRFREHRIIFSADIEKMYRQIGIQDEDTNFQKIVWRENPSSPLKYYKLCTVTYGLASAPFLATRALYEIAQRAVQHDPMAAKNIEHNVYIDDIMTGGDTTTEAKALKSSITTILATYGFKLRKWVSNSHEILEDVPPSNREQEMMKSIEDSTDKTVKILGLQYDPGEDVFKFRVNLPENTQITKRRILSEAGKIFDPLGWIAPVNIKIKVFIQQLWILNLDWDDPLPEKDANQWRQIRTTLPTLEQITIPRFVKTSNKVKIELHGFCDASQTAYAAAIYYRVTNESNQTHISLMTAKTKVAPIKQQTLPRLELCGAVLLTNLMNLVKKETNFNIDQIFLWTDSTIVLDWLTALPRRWPTFVANRTSQILSSFSRAHWGHVASPNNPADVASRGLCPYELRSNSLWWNGPEWLYRPKALWPQQQRVYNLCDDVPETITLTASMLVEETDSLERIISKFSSFHKLQRIVAYVLRFIRHARKPESPRSIGLFLSGKEMYEALFKLCIHNQNKYFAEDIKELHKTKSVKHTSTLKSLNPFIDEFGVLRVGGRLERCEAPFSTKHPILLSPKSPITILILREMHKDYKHAGPSLLLAISRQQYWIPSAKSLIRKIIHRCVPCTRHRATCQTQLMGNLPSYRLETSRPFLKVGVDFAGPIFVYLTKGRGQKKHKMYICLFICVTTKAIHIELVTDLSSDAFLAALKRFIARRGCCQEIFSDNGSNFIGANNQLNKTFENCINTANNISHFLSSHLITWHFIPPHAPHFGGIWESAIKLTKFHLKRVIGDSTLTMEEMMTLLAEIESMLNSRPLCVLSADDIDALTPSHFLIGRPATKLPELDHTHLKQSHLSRWKMIQYMSQHFWKRFQLEYITSLQQRPKWIKEAPSLQLNDIVIIKEDNLPVNKWLLGRILHLHPGSDGLTRVVTIKTKTDELKRSITKIVKLPVEPDGSSPAECSVATENPQFNKPKSEII